MVAFSSLVLTLKMVLTQKSSVLKFLLHLTYFKATSNQPSQSLKKIGLTVEHTLSMYNFSRAQQQPLNFLFWAASSALTVTPWVNAPFSRHSLATAMLVPSQHHQTP